jgi:hypothetical protein
VERLSIATNAIGKLLKYSNLHIADLLGTIYILCQLALAGKRMLRQRNANRVASELPFGRDYP